MHLKNIIEHTFSCQSAMMVIRGLTFHPFEQRTWMSESYLLAFCWVAVVANRSWHYVDSMIWMTLVEKGDRGVVGGRGS